MSVSTSLVLLGLCLVDDTLKGILVDISDPSRLVLVDGDWNPSYVLLATYIPNLLTKMSQPRPSVNGTNT